MQLTRGMPTSETGELVVLQRITSVALMVGGAVALLAAIGFPAGSDGVGLMIGSDTSSSFGSQPVLAWLRAGGVLAVILGFSNVHHYLRTGAGAAWARIGVQTLLISSAGLIAAEGLSAGLFQGTIPSETLTSAVAGMMDLARVLSFTALATLGLAMSVSNAYPRWCGKGLLCLGALAAAAAAAQVLLKPVAVPDGTVVTLGGLVAVWVIAIGAWSAREAWRWSPDRE